jgi:hypothetical protein
MPRNPGEVKVMLLSQEPEWEEMPGGKFLIVRVAKPTRLEKDAITDTLMAGEWDVTNPNHKLLMARVGLTQETGAVVFKIGKKLYTRATRHKVENKPLSSYTPYYQHHPGPWGGTGRKIALQPLEGTLIDAK